MDGDLGGVDIMSDEEEAIDGKSFPFFKKKKKIKKNKRRRRRRRRRKWRYTRAVGSEETKTKKVKGKCVYWKVRIDCDIKK